MRAVDRYAKLAERRRQILTLRKQGKTLEEIGKRYRITRERVRQLVLVAERENGE
jgi:DNA-directed RNA polymerase sigma subunit (sigma70/sigma32)